MCQLLHFARNHRKAAAGFAGTRRFDGCIQREQRGLAGNRLDQLEHDIDLLGGIVQTAHGGVGMPQFDGRAFARPLRAAST